MTTAMRAAVRSPLIVAIFSTSIGGTTTTHYAPSVKPRPAVELSGDPNGPKKRRAYPEYIRYTRSSIIHTWRSTLSL